MKQFKFSLTIVVIIIMSSFSMNSFFHEGAVDKRGGHYDAKEKTYHYHHGCEAHLHEEGRCEFDFKNCKREENSNDSHNHEITLE